MRFRSIVLAGMLVIGAFSAQAEDFGIAAVVNDTAITKREVEERLRLAMFASGVKDTPEARQRLLPQINQMLVDEALYAQEAAQYGFKASDGEMFKAIASLEQRNKLQPGSLPSFLAENGISMDAVKNQLRSQILWARLIARRIRPTVIITDKEVEERMEHIASNSGLSELHLSEIILPVDNPEEEGQVANLAIKLVEELQRGTEFSAIAREFSRANSAVRGGELGWVSQDELQEGLRQKVLALRAGQITKPLRVAEGYYILKLNDRRALIEPEKDETEVGLKQAFVPFDDTENETVQQKQAAALEDEIKQVRGCDAFDKTAKAIGSLVPSEMVMARLRDLEPDILEVVKQSQVGVMSPVIKSSKGLHILMVCERIDAQPSLAQKDQVREMLFKSKVELQAKRYARNLRRNAFIEIRE